MKHRNLVFACALLALPGVSFADDRAAEWQAPRTHWGAPDLQGTWSNETLTPLERPPGADEFVSEEQAAAARDGIARARERDAARLTQSVKPPPKGGNVGAYNLVWIDAGSDVVVTRRSSQVIEPEDGRVPVRASALARRDLNQQLAYADMEYMSPWDRCITRGIPGSMLPAGYNNYYRIVQREDEVLIYYEMIHEARIIPLDKTPRLGLGFWNGEPRGYWEGDTLVVETRGHKPGWIATSFSQARIKGVPSTANLEVVERFTRVSEDVIIWQARITDPEIYSEVWTVELPMVARGAARIYEYACHEGNQAVANILRGARVEEREQGRVYRLNSELDVLVPPDAVIEKIAGDFQFTEGPVWVQPDRLLFSDIPADTVYQWSEAGGVEVFLKPVFDQALGSGGVGGSNGLILDRDGHLLLAEHGNRRIARLDPTSDDRTRSTVTNRWQGKRFNSPNDMVQHSSGALFFTDPPYGLVGLEDSPQRELDHNGVYRLDTDGSVHLLGEQTRPNGIVLSPDERTLIVANSAQPPHRYWMAYDVTADLSLTNPRVFHDASDSREVGVPDGMAVDVDGNVFATGPGGVWVFDRSGRHLGLISPPERPANVTFGEDGRSLFMTARTGLYKIRLSTTGLGF